MHDFCYVTNSLHGNVVIRIHILGLNFKRY